VNLRKLPHHRGLLYQVLGNTPLHATGIEHYLNNCYVCILSAIIPIDVNSVIAVARRSTNLNLTTLALARRVFISKFN